MDKTTCIQCKKVFQPVRNTMGKYCSNRCQRDWMFEHDVLPRFFEGSIFRPVLLKRCLTHTVGYRCLECGNKGIHNKKKLALQLDHIDGKKAHNMPSNLRLLCPNCHSQTETYAGKNKKALPR